MPVRGGVVTNDAGLTVTLAEAGLGLAYAFEPSLHERIRAHRRRRALPYSNTRRTSHAAADFDRPPDNAERRGARRGSSM